MLARSSLPARHAGAGISITVADPQWRAAVPGVEALVRRAARAAQRAARTRGPLTVLLADDATLADLNAAFRGKTYPTNVLSWPRPGGGGDIAVALQRAAREARETGRPLAHHLAHLVVHGTLHCAGRDHEDLKAARWMEREEALVLRRLGLPDPYRRKR
ncbi:rRNA maturation RNase YbeY [Elioraea thermophila]|uniref:rRNA maturation RNase YbeY n=1 Tax=Elioraea thermophila TaxID=2185104 RepID=UPI000DF3E605|nr:rRNA maturation RNase YbeY [Elioraea thermophila]